MHSFPQFTRATLWGEFTWVGTIIFGNVMKRAQFSVGQFSSGAIVLETLRTIASDCSYQVSSFTLRKKTIQAEWRKERVITKTKKKSPKRTQFNKINNASVEF